MKTMNMQAIASCFRRMQFKIALLNLVGFKHLLKRRLLLLAGAFLIGGCITKSEPQPRAIALQQQWTLNPGDEVAGAAVIGSLGDISLYLNGKIYAPFDGEVEASEQEICALYSTPEIPAYLFRLCGLDRVNYGSIKARQTIGKGSYLSFATLRRQPDGTWIIVEPAKDVLEKAITAR